MLTTRAFACALLVVFSTAVAAAQKPAAKQPAGRSETLACRLGTEDRHARIAVVVIRGKTDSFAYYSKWKPRTCSIYLQRNRDSYSKWADTGNITTVNLERGAFLIEHKPGEYHFIFRDIDRERYCGMDGVINGTLIIKRGSEACQLGGDIMVEGTPLGEAQAKVEREPEGPLAPAPPAVPQAAETTPIGGAAPAAKPEATLNLTLPARTAEPPQAAPAAPAQPAAAAPESAPRASAPPETAQKPASPPPSTATTEKPASGNPFSAFFRSLQQQPAPEPQSP